MHARMTVAVISSDANMFKQFSFIRLVDGANSENDWPVKPYTPSTPIKLYVTKTKKKPMAILRVLC